MKTTTAIFIAVLIVSGTAQRNGARSAKRSAPEEEEPTSFNYEHCADACKKNDYSCLGCMIEENPDLESKIQQLSGLSGSRYASPFNYNAGNPYQHLPAPYAFDWVCAGACIMSPITCAACLAAHKHI